MSLSSYKEKSDNSIFGLKGNFSNQLSHSFIRQVLKTKPSTSVGIKTKKGVHIRKGLFPSTATVGLLSNKLMHTLLLQTPHGRSCLAGVLPQQVQVYLIETTTQGVPVHKTVKQTNKTENDGNWDTRQSN